MQISLKSWSSSSEPSLADPAFPSYVQERLFRIKYMKNGAPLTSELYISRANAMALLCKTKRGAAELIDTEDVLAIEEIIPEVPVPKLAVRQLGAVTPDTVRQHMFDRHGLVSDDIPDDGLEAMDTHVRHHADFSLGHRHPVDQFVPPTPEQIALRTEQLNAEYENVFECDSCGYIRLPKEDGRQFRTFERNDEEFKHCETCWDMKEYQYL